MSTSTVPIFDPQGTLRDVPYEQMTAAVKAGGKPAALFQAPDGKQRFVPADQTQDAVKAGGKLIPLSDQPAKSFWSEAGSALWNGITSIPGGLYHAAVDPLTDTHEDLVRKLHAEQASDVTAEASPERQAHGALYRNVGVPAAELVGADVRGMEQGAAEGNPGKVLGTAAVVPTAMAATAGISKAIPVVPKVTTGALDAASEVLNHPVMKALGKTASVLTFDRLGKIVDAWRSLPEELKARSAEAPVFPGAPFPEHPGTFPGAPEPSATPEQLNPSLVSPTRALPGQISPETVAPTPKPTPAPIPPRSGLQLPPAPKGAELAELPATGAKSAAETGEALKSLAELPRKAVFQAEQELGPKASVADLTARANRLSELLNKGLGGKALEPNVPLKNQGGIVTPKSVETVPEGHTPVESSAIKSYKYDPATREFETVTQGGSRYIHGDVSPEQAQEFEAAKSKGKAWNDIRQSSTLVAKVINGKRVPVKPVIGDEDVISPEEWEHGHALETQVEGSPR